MELAEDCVLERIERKLSLVVVGEGEKRERGGT